MRSFDRQPTPPKVWKVFVAFVCFVVERQWLFFEPRMARKARRGGDGVGLWLGQDACTGIGSGRRLPST
jgi:hypothetical protein